MIKIRKRKPRIMSEEARQRMIAPLLNNRGWKKGSHHSKETKQIIREKRKLQIMKPRTEEVKEKIKHTILYGPKNEQRKRNISKSLTGRKLSKEHREKISYYSKLKKGPLASNWRGGKSYEEYTIDWNETLRKSIRERDNYTCQLCSKQQGDTAFHVHHIDYEKKNCNPLNLITLCINCHMKTGGNRDYWKKYFENLMIGLR